MNNLTKIYEELLGDLEFQLRFAEMARTSKISITKEQGYLVLAVMQLIVEKGIWVPNKKEETEDG